MDFQLKQNNTTVKTELLAGLTTFNTMAYILAVNPDILSATGMDKGGVFTATALSAFVGCVIMGLFANLPFALAPGMGLNAFFAYTVVLSMGYSWEFALTAVFLEGLIFLAMTALNIREAIINAIPLNLKHAISVGIALYIAFIGLQNAGIIVKNDAVLVGLGSFKDPQVQVAWAGLFISGVLLVLKVKGALLFGILAATILGIPMGITHLPESFFSLPPSLSPVFAKFEWDKILTSDMAIVLFTFLFIDMFDTIGALVGIADQAGMLDEKGRVPRAKQALFADAVGTTLGAIFGTSTVTTFMESAAGVAVGGRTGLTTLTVGAFFLVSLFLAPVFLMIPTAATAPALILVGLFMIKPILKINMDDYTESIPAFITIIFMPLAYSIADGIALGMASYVILKLLTGRYKEVSPLMIILGVLFGLKFFIV